jgi:hypothetical protein
VTYRKVGKGLYEVWAMRDGQHVLVAKHNGSLASVQGFIRRKMIGELR